MSPKRQPAAPKGKRGFDLREYLESIGPARRSVRYRRGEIAFSQGDPANDVRYIRNGTIKLSVVSRYRQGGGRRDPGPRRLLRRGCPGGSVDPHGDCDRSCGDRRPGHREGRDAPAAPRGARVLGPLHLPHPEPEYPHRSGSRRSALQHQRETPRAGAAPARALRPGRTRRRRCRRSLRRPCAEWSGPRARA